MGRLRLEPTYEGLKRRSVATETRKVPESLEPTYEGLKRRLHRAAAGVERGLEPTYEGLKLRVARVAPRRGQAFGAYL